MSKILEMKELVPSIYEAVVQADEIAKKAKENQEQNSVLERQGEGRQAGKKVPTTPLGLADAFKSLQRRI